jgi:hypothetical protein
MKDRKKSSELIPLQRIQNTILMIRGQKVMLDNDLAELYRVETKQLVRAMKRNLDRFPLDFMFRLSKEEFANLRYHFGTSKIGRGGRRYPPYAFTEHGAIMLASVLNSPKAVEASVYVVRAFVRLREIISSNSELARKLAELERKVAGHDSDIKSLIAAIRQLMAPPKKPGRQIGFK